MLKLLIPIALMLTSAVSQAGGEFRHIVMFKFKELVEAEIDELARILSSEHGKVLAEFRRAVPLDFPQNGWVEQSPGQLWQAVYESLEQALQFARNQNLEVACAGLTNQRETVGAWNKTTGRALAPAIVWQDRRTTESCEALKQKGLESEIRQRTGLGLDPYFSAGKMAWLLEIQPEVKRAAEQEQLALGTVDSWLMWQLSGGAVHATDVSNASRTMLFNIHTHQWDTELLAALRIPPAMMPTVRASSALYGQVRPELLGHAITIGGVAGDQQSALFGQACFGAGMAKNTYGTGCFMLMHTGHKAMHSQNGLITTSAAQVAAMPHSAPQFALEGSVFVGGAVVQWLRDGLGAIRHSSEVQALAESVPDSGGVMVVPAFTGLGAPYWRPDARGSITGLTRGSTVAHIARAALESIAFQSAALLQAMGRDLAQAGVAPVQELRVDGGACVNNLLMQFQADLLGLDVVRPEVTETTALGAAYLAGLSTGVYASTVVLSGLWRAERRFTPQRLPDFAAEQMALWEHAVRKTVL
jgi:glycerol kinase